MTNPANDILIVANAPSLPFKQVSTLAKNRLVVALDGAANKLFNKGLTPNVVLGDFDSLNPKLQEVLSSKFLHMPDQKYSDLQKALLYCKKLKPQTIIIINATGGRMDHTLLNLRLLKKFHDPKGPKIELFTSKEVICYIENETVEIHGHKGEICAIFGFSKARVSSKGLKYELVNTELALGEQESGSNELRGNEAMITVEGSALFMQGIKISQH